ncbi:ABC transporter substrate-binding protein [Limobrevibacterium gyesilva]|uniref:ABC transporter substrate-binding protein n=1 Tax=Limobrevibacterium gyesilva TaxID=2991712 RepID=A0AA41YKJ4_9PROT|nr:ABC transporter substrate-binding protein [Limobrevibacterium gyesilva]MCW3474056.1 ABC transporter substrate-binding protein [Limobrevibacterium gyesilva]
MTLRRRTLLAAGLAAPALLPARNALAQPRTLTLGVVSDPVTLDPAFSGSFFENQVFYNLHETLLVAQPDGQVVPGLASCEMKNALTYVFTLKPNLTFHDGTPIDAAAAKANIDRYLDPAVGSIRRADYGPTSGVEVTDKLVFTIKLSAPYAPLPLVLTNRAGMLVSPKAVATMGADFATRAVGAGPYKLASWTKNAELVLEKFAGYWRGADHGFDHLVYRPIPDETVRLANLRSGTLQLIDSVPPQAVGQLGREPAVKVAQMPSLGFNGWSLNCTRAPFSDARVRRAFLAAVDPEVIHRVVYFGTGRVGRGPLSPAVAWAFDPDFNPPGHNPKRARQLLAEAGAPSPLPVTITVTNSPQMVRIAQIIQAQAADAGFQVTVKQIDPTSLITVLRQRDFDVCMSPWSGRYDPDGNMFFYFTKGGPNNFPGYDSDRMTGLLTQARSATDRAERVRLYHEAQNLLAEDAPMLFLHFDAILQASAANLKWTQYPDAAWRLYDARIG